MPEESRGPSGALASDRRVPVSKREIRPIWRVLAVVVIPLVWLLVGIRRQGSANVPREGAFVIAPNHTSNFDPLVMGIAVFLAGRTPHFLGKASLFRVPVVGAILRATGQIPVERAGSSRDNPLSTARTVAERGSGVIVYPEGTLTRDPDLWPMRGKTGAVRLALSAGIPLIPVAHTTERFLAPYARFPRLIPRQRITVRYGSPVDLSEFEGRGLDAAVITAATDRLMAAITAIVEELRGETAPPTRWDPAQHNQSEFGHPTARD